MPEWIVKYWVEWAFGLIIAGFGFVVKRLSAKIKKEKEAREQLAQQAAAETEALKAGMKSLLRRQIIADCKEAMRDGYCDETVRDTITAMYEAYHGLGGNGSVTDAYNSMRKLPLVSIDHQ